MLKKIKIINSVIFDRLVQVLKDAGGKVVIIHYLNSTSSKEYFNPMFPETIKATSAYDIDYALTQSNTGKKFYVRRISTHTGGLGGYTTYKTAGYFTYPEWNEKDQVYEMYPANDQGEKI